VKGVSVTDCRYSAVIPLLIYHGPTAWNVARNVADLVDVPRELKRFVPQLSLELCDLSRFSDDNLPGGAFLHATLLL